MESKIKDLDDASKNVLRLMICGPYIEYCKQIYKEDKILFEYKGEMITVKEASKLFNTTNKKDFNTDFLKKFTTYAMEDEEYKKFQEEMDMTCEECQHVPVKETELPQDHPDVVEYFKEFGEDHIGTEVKCPMCNHRFVYFTSSYSKK